MDAIALAIPFFFLLIGVELVWSWWSGRKVYRFNDLVANLGCGIGSQVVGAFSKTVIFAAYLWVHEHLRLFTVAPSVLTWLVAFLLVDLLYYWFHRLSHEVNILWAAHVVHHQSEEYNLSVALRQSWFQGLFSWWFYLPMALLGFHPVVIVTVGAINTLYQFWIHTRAIGRMGPFEWLLNTPSHHRVHHGSDPKYIDRNHAGTLIIWDKLFGTFQQEEEEPVYGITKPLASWEPVHANLATWADLIALAKQCPRWSDKVRVFLKPPGWRPAALGGPQRPVKQDPAAYRKFDTRVRPAVERYVFVQFWLLVGVASFFLFKQAHLPVVHQVLLAALVVVWLMGLGLLLEGRAAGLVLEVVRVLGTGSLALFISAGLLPGPVAWVAAALVVFSLAWLALLYMTGPLRPEGSLGATPT